MLEIKSYVFVVYADVSLCVSFFLRPEMDTEWTYIREPIETNSMVLKGLIPETEYQFVVRAVNVYGVSPPSNINNPVRTLGKNKCLFLIVTLICMLSFTV